MRITLRNAKCPLSTRVAALTPTGNQLSEERADRQVE